MLKRIVKALSQNPRIFNILRRVIEFNFVTIKKAIAQELFLNEALPRDGHKKILDVPCGTGEFCMFFKPESYIGIDISQTYINYAKKNYKRAFFCRDALNNGFNDGYFSSVLVVGFFHHLDDRAIDLVLKEIRRSIKIDGKLLLIEDAPTSSRWNIIGRALQGLDVGERIRGSEAYIEVLKKYFMIDKYYPIRSGFWDYSVFVLQPNK